MSVKFSNNGKTTLASAITSAATTINVADSTVFPSISGSEYFYMTLDDGSGNVEIVKVTGVSSNTLTVTRGQESTTARAYAAGDKAENRLTAGGLNDATAGTDPEFDSVSIPDNGSLYLGDSNDLRIYHSGTHSYIWDTGTGDLILKGSDDLKLQTASGEKGLIVNADASVQIYYDNQEKFTTTSTGISVTGGIQTTAASTFDGQVTISAATPSLIIKDSNSGAGGAASGSVVWQNTAGKSIGIGTNGTDTTSSDLYISSNAASTYGGYLGLDAAGINDNQADIVLDPKSDTVLANGGLKVGTSTVIDSSRNITNVESIGLDDNKKIILGTHNDLQLFHDGSDSIISDEGTGNLRLKGNGSIQLRNSVDDAIMVNAITGGEVQLRYDGATKISTTNTGVNVNGDATFGDNDKALFGDDGDLEIYHDGTKSLIKSATSDVQVRVNGGGTFKVGDEFGNFQFVVNDNSDVQLYHGQTPALKFATTATGCAVTGDITASGNVGVGTTSNHAGARVVINDTPPTAFGSPMLQVGQETFTASGYYSIGLGYTAGSYTEPPAEIAAVSTSSSGGTTADIVFGTRSVTTNTAVTERMRINSSGNVGIGTTSPTKPLCVQHSSGAASEFEPGNAGGFNRFINFDRTASEYHPLQTEAELIRFATGTGSSVSERMRIDSSGNVGIGDTNPSAKLEVSGGSADYISSATGTGLFHVTGGASSQYSMYVGVADQGVQIGHNGSGTRFLSFETNETERMRIDSSGNVGIGATSLVNKFTVNGNQVLLANGELKFADAGNSYVATIKNSGVNGVSRLEFLTGSTPTERMRIDGSGNITIGGVFGTASGNSNDLIFRRAQNTNSQISIGTVSNVGRILVKTNSYGAGFQTRSFYGSTMIAPSQTGDDIVNGFAWSTGSNSLYPARSSNTSLYRDNVADLGLSSARWDDVYATNGTIQTSDEREKQDIEALNEAEQRVAVAAKGLLRKFRWKDKVAAKGDDARIHFGIIAQDLEAAFTAEGLDPGRYAMFIKTEWWVGDKVYPAVAEETDEDGNVIVEGREESTDSEYHYDNEADAPDGAVYHYRMGVRYSELLAFIIAAI